MFSIKGHNQAISRAMLLLTLLLASALAAFGAQRLAPPAPLLKEKEIKKGVELIAKLRLLEELTDTAPDFKTYRALMNKLSQNLFIKAAELAESDLRTDLTTAIFLYDEALQRYDDSERAETICPDEARVTYRKLCANEENKTVRELLWAKARLHISWAVAVINYNQGAKDAATIAALQEMQAERLNDLKFGEQAVKKLQALEEEVCAYASLREFEEHGSLARVSFNQLSQDVADALPVVDRTLRSLPRSPLFYALYHARNSYLDGLFWWRKTYRQKEMVVSVNSFAEPDEMKSTGMDSSVVNYTIAINWRKAINHTREAAQLIEAARANLNQARASRTLFSSNEDYLYANVVRQFENKSYSHLASARW